MTAQAGDTLYSKACLRREFRRGRARLSRAQRERAAQQAARRVARSKPFQRARKLALYLQVGSELSTEPLLALCLRERKDVYVPRIGRNGRMCFVRWDPRCGWRHNRHGIREPRRGASLPLTRLDLVILPLVAFDAFGTRLGAGGGYYDRALAAARGSRPFRMGYAYALQQAAQLPREPWDQPLHAVVTDRAYHLFPESPSAWPTG